MFLQRASAGSGKTFKLTKIYIRNLISSKFTNSDDSVSYILRHPSELSDAHSHILAITFTNKATNEMKERIVEKLADLMRGPITKPDGSVEEPDYLSDFKRELVNPDYTAPSDADIQRVCGAALKGILNSYSDFHISTIDAFFQSILRTFAYELEINDNYRVELNDDYLAKIGVDETLSMVNHASQDGAKDVYEWLSRIINTQLSLGNSWDIFSQKIVSDNSMYAELLKFTRKISRENFNFIKDSLRNYFDKNPKHFPNFYEAVSTTMRNELTELRKDCRNAIENLEQCFNNLFPEGSIDTYCSAGIGTYITALKRAGLNCNTGKPRGANFSKFVPPNTEASMPGISPLKSAYNKKVDSTELSKRMFAVGQAVEVWERRAYYWKIISSKLHYLGLLNTIVTTIERYRTENDIVPLSDTNGIIHKIIGTDDAPFIYERMGNQISNFLIDEFQDTSVMQWSNLRPLLENSESIGNDNLIIGDAKQSIYRFRNAEPDLITYQVEADFPNTEIWNSQTDNTNWRSAYEIVAFNNSLFSNLPMAVDRDTQSTDCFASDKLKRRCIASLYDNAQQTIHHSDRKGYVSVNFSTDISLENSCMLIQDILKRGYSQSDIVILADTNGECENIIRTIMSLNQAHSSDTDYVQVEIISEESLKVNESEAVKLILSVLELTANRGILKTADNKLKIETFVCLGNYLAAQNPNFDISEFVSSGIKNFSINKDVEELVASVSSMTLPSIIEVIVDKFMPQEMRDKHAAYISAFQDQALEYCENNASDILSFLKWWNANGSKITISSPDGINAVQVMTIHKSKGLEFDCVIIPSATWQIAPTKEGDEILWVKSNRERLSNECGVEPDVIPPYLPIVPNAKLVDPEYGFRDEYIDYADKCRIDQINKTYVAFTRAAKELHVFAPESIDMAKPSTKISRYLLRLLSDSTKTTEGEYNPNEHRYCFGTPTLKTTVRDNNELNLSENIDSYYINPVFPEIYYCVEDAPATDNDDDTTEMSEEMRMNGVLIHEILAEVRTRDDVERAVRRRVIRGTIDTATGKELVLRLKSAIDTTGVSHWYDPKNRIISERDICCEGKVNRPDRIVISPDGVITIIDYKTGDPEHASRYRRQLLTYRNLMEKYCRDSGLTPIAVEAYLFYISPNPAERTDCIISLEDL